MTEDVVVTALNMSGLRNVFVVDSKWHIDVVDELVVYVIVSYFSQSSRD